MIMTVGMRLCPESSAHNPWKIYDIDLVPDHFLNVRFLKKKYIYILLEEGGKSKTPKVIYNIGTN